MYNPNNAINAAIRSQAMRRRWPVAPRPQVVPTYAAAVPQVDWGEAQRMEAQRMMAQGNMMGQQSDLGRVLAPAFSFQPPGVRAKLDQYNYEKMPDNTWKVYPPGQPAPPTGWQASMPVPANAMDLERIQQEQAKVESMMKQQQTLATQQALGTKDNLGYLQQAEKSYQQPAQEGLNKAVASYSQQQPAEKQRSAQPYRDMMR